MCKVYIKSRHLVRNRPEAFHLNDQSYIWSLEILLVWSKSGLSKLCVRPVSKNTFWLAPFSTVPKNTIIFLSLNCTLKHIYTKNFSPSGNDFTWVVKLYWQILWRELPLSPAFEGCCWEGSTEHHQSRTCMRIHHPGEGMIDWLALDFDDGKQPFHR